MSEWHPTAAAIEWTFPRDNLTCPPLRLPPLNALPVWHVSHSTASSGAAGAGKSASIHQSETRLVELGRAMGGFGSGSTAIAGRVPRTRGEQGGGGGPGEDGAGRGSHGDPSSSPGRRGAPLPVPLLGRVVQLIVGDQSIRWRFVPAFAFRPATCPMAFLGPRHLLVREALVLGGTPGRVALALGGEGEAVIHGEGIDVHVVALVGALVQSLLPGADLQGAVPHPIAKVDEQTWGGQEGEGWTPATH